MNANRRKRIADARAALEAVANEVRMIGDEEREAYENLPDSIKESDRGMASDGAADALSGAADSIDDLMNELEEAAA